MGYANKILDMNGTPFCPVLINGEKEIKLTKAGVPKRTPNNSQTEQFVEPIRDKNDVLNIYKYLDSKIEEEKCFVKKFKLLRNKMIFVIGISVGLRVSDLLKITWGDIFELNMKTFKTVSKKKEKKTGKIKQFYITPQMQAAIIQYLDETKLIPEKDEPIFIKSIEKRVPICDATIALIVKELTDACGIKGLYSTHSLRKTCAYHMYMRYLEIEDPLALPKVQKFLNHRNQSDTLRYLGIETQMEQQVVQDMYFGLF